ncbi:hypothetical protein ANN_16461 [Periplaneta americana]|uniref:RNase H type-1 domain-containing protein n=1 Tax=Periplaneta americana TaxID=6978 RepID=A0ABQ8SJ33_PERAM|nr:hypothetical protein ANN_16461 [Periplaneta americana]
MGSGSIYTSAFVDSFNGVTVYPQHGKNLHCRLSSTSKHLEYWKKVLLWSETGNFSMRKLNVTSPPPSQDAWITSINGIQYGPVLDSQVAPQNMEVSIGNCAELQPSSSHAASSCEISSPKSSASSEASDCCCETEQAIHEELITRLANEKEHSFKLAPELSERDPFPSHFGKMEVCTSTKSLGYGTTSFDGEIIAISECLRNLLCHINKFRNAVILSDSKAAILSIVSKHTPSSQTAEITKMLSQLISLNKRIVFQWIPSHCGILGNENADALAKKGSTATYRPVTKSTYYSVKRFIKSTYLDFNKQNLITQSQGKKWNSLHQNPQLIPDLPRKSSVAAFRLATGHDCLAKHLHRIGIYQSPNCPLCNSNQEMDSEHLKICASVAGHDNIFEKYWSARGQMTLFKLEDEVTAAEGTFASSTAKHHNSYNVMACTPGLLKTTFPDSDIAKNGKTRTEAIINSVLCNEIIFLCTHKALKLFCTLPVTTATPERSFSTLRYLKTYLRSTMGADRLNALALMFIHKNVEVKAHEVLDEMSKNPRRLLL